MPVGRRVAGLFSSGKRLLSRLPGRNRSLRVRLILFFAVFLVAAWLTAAVFAWRESRAHIDEFFDTQQMLFAKTLAMADFGLATGSLPKTKSLLPGVKKKARGEEEEDALGFAVFTSRGELLLTDGEKGERFLFDGWTRGFSNSLIARSDDLWRMVWLVSPDGKRVVAVGQELEYREEMALSMLFTQLLPWTLLLPVLLAGLLWMLSRELAPLRNVAKELEARTPDDTSPLRAADVPSEVHPLVASLNALFTRTGAMLARERAFISDAAHELRTPLAGLRVQAEVVELAAEDPEARRHAVGKLLTGIDRCGHLIEQLLTLSRLDALGGSALAKSGMKDEGVAAGWPELLAELLDEYRDAAEEKEIAVDYAVTGSPPALAGVAAASAILARNLLDNAVKYTPAGGHIRIELDERHLSVFNSCSGVPERYLPRLGERFFRPPGQDAPGSGLGLSLVRQIAAMQGLRLVLSNSDGGFTAEVFFSDAVPSRE